jgi:uncharacterized protein YjbI with pentapeptide repeats
MLRIIGQSLKVGGKLALYLFNFLFWPSKQNLAIVKRFDVTRIRVAKKITPVLVTNTSSSFPGCDLEGLDSVLANTRPSFFEKTKELLEQVVHASKFSQILFFNMVVFCLFCLLLTATITDLNLLLNNSSTPLPFIALPIPTLAFFWVAPIGLVGLYIYQHLYLQRLWEQVGRLPAIFPDGIPVDEKISPWIITTLIRYHSPLLKTHQNGFFWLEFIGGCLLSYGLVPITLAVMVGRSLAASNFIITWWLGITLCLSVTLGCLFWQGAKGWLRCLRVNHNCKRLIRTVIYSIFISGTFTLYLRANFPNSLLHLTLPQGSELSQIPQDYKKNMFDIMFNTSMLSDAKATAQTELNKQISSFKGAYGDYQYLFAPQCFLAQAFLQASDFSYSTLNGSDFHESVLDNSKLDYAKLNATNFEKANMRYASLVNTNLTLVNFNNANLSHAHLTKAVLDESRGIETNLEYVDLSQSSMKKAMFQQSNFSNANLSYANLGSSDFVNSIFTSAIFGNANLKDVNFSSADLTNADFTNANLDGTQFANANLNGTILVDLSKGSQAVNFTNADLSRANFSRYSFHKLKSHGLSDAEIVNAYTPNIEATWEILRELISEQKTDGSSVLTDGLKGAKLPARLLANKPQWYINLEHKWAKEAAMLPKQH